MIFNPENNKGFTGPTEGEGMAEKENQEQMKTSEERGRNFISKQKEKLSLVFDTVFKTGELFREDPVMKPMSYAIRFAGLPLGAFLMRRTIEMQGHFTNVYGRLIEGQALMTGCGAVMAAALMAGTAIPLIDSYVTAKKARKETE